MLSGLKGRSSWVTSRMPPAVSEVCVCDLSTHLVLNVSLFHLARQNLLGVLRFSVNVLPCVTIKVLVDCKTLATIYFKECPCSFISKGALKPWYIPPLGVFWFMVNLGVLSLQVVSMALFRFALDYFFVNRG